MPKYAGHLEVQGEQTVLEVLVSLGVAVLALTLAAVAAARVTLTLCTI